MNLSLYFARASRSRRTAAEKLYIVHDVKESDLEKIVIVKVMKRKPLTVLFTAADVDLIIAKYGRKAIEEVK